MKVSISSIAEIKATKVIPSADFVLLAKDVAGRKAIVDIDAAATVAALIDAAKVSLRIDPAIIFAEVTVKHRGANLDKTKNLADNRVSDGASLTISFKRII